MRVGLSGWNGFLANKLRESDLIEWVDGVDDIDAYFHLGSPTFTEETLTKDQAQRMHAYVLDSVVLFDQLTSRDIHLAFASTTGVNDIQLTHSGSTSYNLSKLFLENYLVNKTDKHVIFRIGTIYSTSPNDVASMKQDRVQPRIMRGDIKSIPYTDHYLNVDRFVNATVHGLLTKYTGIFEYDLTELSIPKLRT